LGKVEEIRQLDGERLRRVEWRKAMETARLQNAAKRRQLDADRLRCKEESSRLKLELSHKNDW
jgi:hypothetical protein